MISQHIPFQMRPLFLCALALAMTQFVGISPAWAQTPPWPTKPITLIVTYPPGGGADAMARLVAPKMAEVLGQNVVLENRPGASGQIGASAVAKATPDGYTLMLANIALALNPGLNSKLPYDALRDLAPIILLASQPNALAAAPNLPVNSVKELIALSKNGSTKLSFASSGNGSVGHVSGEMLRIAIGADMIHVPYKGGGPAVTDLISGRIPLALISLPTVMSHMKAGRLKVLAITDSKRSAAAPNIPTLSETIAGFQVNNWIGLLAPARTPKNIILKINADSMKLIQADELKDRLLSNGFDVIGSTPEEFAKAIRGDIEKYSKVIRASNI